MLEFGLRNEKCLSLAGTYPDDIAVNMYPVIGSIEAVETNKRICNDMLGFAQYWSALSGFKTTYTHGNILDQVSTARVNDLDMMCILSEQVVDSVSAFIERITLPGPIGIMIWNMYGREITKAQHQDNLTKLLNRIACTFRINTTWGDSYRDSQNPMWHQTLVIERKQNVITKP
jgi:hypothetical protein